MSATTPAEPEPVDAVETPSRARTFTAFAIAAVVLIIIAFGGGWLTGRGEPQPTDTSASAGFARDMQTHHEQAVEMAMSVLTSTEDPTIRQLAYDIATSQGQQSGQLYAMLNEWGLPQASLRPPMEWMLQPTLDGSSGSMADHGMADTPDGEIPDRMPGMASSEQMARLHSARGVEAERLFLELMIDHHNGGVAMAQAVLPRTEHRGITAFARAVVAAQTAEIDYMEQLLAQRGGRL